MFRSEVRDPVTASDRLTRWNSWTDGESPDGKRTQVWPPSVTDGPSACPAVAPESATGPEGQMTSTAAEQRAMRRALELAATPGVPLGPNPRVGCLLLADDGTVVAEGFHRGAGTLHAEADALERAGDRARGTTAVVTLEPCNHTGRTGPCSQALLEAGVAR